MVLSPKPRWVLTRMARDPLVNISPEDPLADRTLGQIAHGGPVEYTRICERVLPKSCPLLT